MKTLLATSRRLFTSAPLLAAAVAPAVIACTDAVTSGSATEDLTNVIAPRGGAGPVVQDFKITILDDMIVSRRTKAEWGFAALVEVTLEGGAKKKILFDTGGSANLVLDNNEAMTKEGLLAPGELCSAEDVVLSHNHNDHTSGLVAIRQACAATNPNALGRAHIGGPEMFWSRPKPDGANANTMTAMKGKYEEAGGQFVTHEAASAFEGIPGVYLTGKIARAHDEKTYPTNPNIEAPDGTRAPDLMPEEMSLVINTAQGLVVITGCAHAGVVNTLLSARAATGGEPTILAVVGGIHTIDSPLGTPTQEGSLQWFAKELKQLGVQYLLGSHCTGLERLPFFREALELDNTHAVFTTVGVAYSLSGGIKRPSPAVNNPILP